MNLPSYILQIILIHTMHIG